MKLIDLGVVAGVVAGALANTFVTKFTSSFESSLMSTFVTQPLTKIVKRLLRNRNVAHAQFLHYHLRHPAKNPRVCHEGQCEVVPL